jgi:hypothetical protein
MAIDRIGKGGVPPVAPQGAGASERISPSSGAGGAEKTFEVRPSVERAGPTQPPQAVGTTPLERLRAGEIDVDGYVDLKVEQATAHLRGLPSAQIEAIRGTLRQQAASDPALADLVQQAAAGRAPTPRE